MKPDPAAAAVGAQNNKTERVFTAQSANRALVLVRKVVQDIVDRYAELMALRAEREELSNARGSLERLEELNAAIERAVAQLNRLHEELTEIGCDLKDWATGLIDFPATYQGRKVWLCWKLGEPAVTHWHELNTGYTGRQLIGPDFP